MGQAQTWAVAAAGGPSMLRIVSGVALRRAVVSGIVALGDFKLSRSNDGDGRRVVRPNR